MNKLILILLYKRAVVYIVILLLFLCAFGGAGTDLWGASASASLCISDDSLWVRNQTLALDSILLKRNSQIKLNSEAIRSIQFDFSPNEKHKSSGLVSSPIEKPWMDFKVDLSLPKSMIDSTKVRKPQNYIRMLPYSIWTLFGENPVYDILVFGHKKQLEITWQLNLDKLQEYGRNLKPNAGRYNPNRHPGGTSVVIENLDFIGFLYNNLNKHGRTLKHNKKHANAWKTYGNIAPGLPKKGERTSYDLVHDSLANGSNIYYNETASGLYHHSESAKLIEEKHPKYFEKPDHRLLQTTEQRSRFGTYYDPELYALPSDFEKENFSANDSVKFNDDDKKKGTKNKRRKRKKVRKPKTNSEKDKTLEELPNSMEDLYKYIQLKKQQDSIQRAEIFRKDKADQNVYELEKQQRKLKERQN